MREQLFWDIATSVAVGGALLCLIHWLSTR